MVWCSISFSPSSPTSAPAVNPKMNWVSTSFSPSLALAALTGATSRPRRMASHFLAFMGTFLHPLAARGSSAMNFQNVPIGVVSARSGVRVPTIRYYEQIGLLPKPPRAKNNRRLYSTTDLRRLTFIRRARELGFDIKAIRALLSLQDDPNQSCRTADTIARIRL